MRGRGYVPQDVRVGGLDVRVRGHERVAGPKAPAKMKLQLDRLPTEILIHEDGTIEFRFDKTDWGGPHLIAVQDDYKTRKHFVNFGHTHTDSGRGPRIWKETYK